MTTNAINTSQTAARAENVRRAWGLRKSGASIRKIAAALQVSHTTAHDWVREGLAEVNADRNAEVLEYRQKQLEMLADVQVSLWKRAVDSESPAQDFAVRSLLRCLDAEARLLGLYQAVKYEHTTRDADAPPGGVMTDAQLRELYTPDEAMRVAARLSQRYGLLARTFAALAPPAIPIGQATEAAAREEAPGG